VQVIPVQSAQQMFEASVDLFPSVDIAVLAAAVSDYTPARTSATKIKKDAGPENLELVRTKDIAMELGNMKKNGQLVIGFALETNDAEVHAKEKLKKKNFDFIVLNTLEDQGSGFGHDTNVVKFIFPDNDSRSFGLKSKIDVAADICEAVAQLMRSHD
jgi:phosphopantothenoylcysteine decarboxylase/phosphopantothenate--cysteine ligase